MKADPEREPAVLAILDLAETLLRASFASQARRW